MWERNSSNTVFVVENDVYSRQAIVSYLSWDRRTRVIGQAKSAYSMLSLLGGEEFAAQRIDVVVLDTSTIHNIDKLHSSIEMIKGHLPGVGIICLDHDPDAARALAAQAAGAVAYLVRDRVGIAIAWSVRLVLKSRRFVITEDIIDCPEPFPCPFEILPERRSHPRLTQRIEQALRLCVVEGLPAELAATEMGVSTSTVRSYIKEGYRILEASDDTVYPSQMSPAERAFLRYTALSQVAVSH